MFKNLSFREWFAWKLVCIAHKIFNADFYELVELDDANILVVGSRYGHGILSSTGFDWNNFKEFDTYEEAADFMYGPEAE